MTVTPDSRNRRPLAELTPPPVQSSNHPIAFSGFGGDAVYKPLTVQKFSLRSRRSAPYHGIMQPGVEYLKLPLSHLTSGSVRSACVRLCSCSWERPLLCGDPARLCQRNTEDHDEYQLLDAMSRRFAAERGAVETNANTVNTRTMSLAAAAASQEVDVYFILEPCTDTVVGYIALQKGSRSDSRWLLYQIYVEPECRRMGFATSALRVLLAGSLSVAISTQHLIMYRIMQSLGFTDGRDLFPAELIEADDLFPYTFYRWAPDDRWAPEDSQNAA